MDIARGTSLALMLFVNHAGRHAEVPWLAHARWHGIHLADIVMPSFLFIVGVSISIALTPVLERSVPRRSLYCKALSRAGPSPSVPKSLICKHARLRKAHI